MLCHLSHMTTLLLGISLAPFSACPCHQFLIGADHQELVEVEIGEFCGEALEDVEAPGYTITIEETIVAQTTLKTQDAEQTKLKVE